MTNDHSSLPSARHGASTASDRWLALSCIFLGGACAIFATVSALSRAVVAYVHPSPPQWVYSGAILTLALVNVAFVVVGFHIRSGRGAPIAFARRLSLVAIVLALLAAGAKGMFLSQLNREVFSGDYADDRFIYAGDRFMDAFVFAFALISLAWYLVLPAIVLLGTRKAGEVHTGG